MVLMSSLGGGNNVSHEAQLRMLADKHFNVRAYIAPKDRALLNSQTFVAEIREWVKEKASKHQQLHGGTFLFYFIDNSLLSVSSLSLSLPLLRALGPWFRFSHKQAT